MKDKYPRFSVQSLNRFMNGLEIKINATNSTYQIDVQEGICRDSDDELNISLLNPITLDITVSEENGLDTGTETADTWYYIWLIYNETTKITATLLSISNTVPTMPSGFTYKRRIGSIWNNASSNFRSFRMFENGNYKYIILDSAENLISSGTATVYTQLDASNIIPKGCILAEAEVKVSKTADKCSLSYKAESIITDPSRKIDGYDQICCIQNLNFSINQIIEYKVDAGCSCEMNIIGYWEKL